jgi:hypothetical protein
MMIDIITAHDPDNTCCPWRYSSDTPRAHEWPLMLGLLTIIGDAVRGVPWGSGDDDAVTSLPRVGSVWVHKHEDFVWVVKSVDPERRWVTPQDDCGLSLDRFLLYYRPATVTPTDEYQTMRERLDGISELAKRYSELRLRAVGLEAESKLLSTVVDALDGYTVIPTPTADGWRRLADEKPAEGEMCWWWSTISGKLLICPPWDDPSGLNLYTWLWQPVPPGVIPPPPANRDGGQ